MRGIIGTTLSFVAREMQQREAGSRTSDDAAVPRVFGMGNNVDSYYFYGQGATFVVPMRPRFAFGHFAGLAGMDDSVNEAMEQAEAELEAAQDKMEARSESFSRAFGTSYGGPVTAPVPPPLAPPAPPVAPAPAVAPVPPAPPAPPAAVDVKRTARQTRNLEESRKRLAEAQEKMKEKVKQRRMQSELSQKRLQESIDQIKIYLVEALANHGDSLTLVKPNEYINIVITADGDNFMGSDERKEVISVQKSTITDYKAGRLTLDAFKQKVLQYTE